MSSNRKGEKGGGAVVDVIWRMRRAKQALVRSLARSFVSLMVW